MNAQFPDLGDLYRDVILDHYRTPRGRKELPGAQARNEGYNPLCGDEVTLAVEFSDGKVADVSVQSRGCSISVASGSMLAELLPGKTVAEARVLLEAFKSMMHGKGAPEKLDIGDLDALEGVKRFPVRVKCALLPWETLKDALTTWESGKKS